MSTPSQLIDLLGGPTSIARLLNIQPPSVTAWRSAGVLPGRVAELAIATGRVVKSLDDLSPENWHRIWPELLQPVGSVTVRAGLIESTETSATGVA